MENGIPVTTVEPGKSETGRTEKDEIPDQIREISSRISKGVKDFRESESYEKVQEATETARDYIRKNPLPSMLYALGAGLFLGMFLKRKR
jgi:ElaB/YqjD/DUF883 family membrane-anchored ribosome-binding protein